MTKEQITILVVEDQRPLADLFAGFLRELSEDVTVAGTLSEAMQFVIKEPQVDLITLDLSLPDSPRDMTVAHIKEIRRHQPGAIILVVTGWGSFDVERDVMRQGAHGFITKPMVEGPKTFWQTLRAVVLAIIRNPTTYQNNLKVAESLLAVKAIFSEEPLAEA